MLSFLSIADTQWVCRMPTCCFLWGWSSFPAAWVLRGKKDRLGAGKDKNEFKSHLHPSWLRAFGKTPFTSFNAPQKDADKTK